MTKKNENETAKRSPLSYELIVRNGKAPQEDGAPHLILRRPAENSEPLKIVDPSKTEEPVEKPEVSEEIAGIVDAAEIASANSVADYVSSLQNHVADDVTRVVDAIIAEEGKLPTNLPKLDDKLTMIFPGSDVQQDPSDEFFYERKDFVAEEDGKSSNYTKKVEYEDL